MTAVHRIQATGIEVMAGMIVGFDTDDPSIFEEQFQFIQQARIPISMTGMLNAIPKTPLHARLKAAGRLIADSVGDQFVFTNVVPGGMSRLELYEGYRSLLRRLYGYRAYRRRAMDFILNRGSLVGSRVLARGDDLAVVGRIVWTCILRTSPRRTWLTLSMALETAWRRPEAIRQAFTLALMHKHFYEYVRDVPGAGGPDPAAAGVGADGTGHPREVTPTLGGLAVRAPGRCGQARSARPEAADLDTLRIPTLGFASAESQSGTKPGTSHDDRSADAARTRRAVGCSALARRMRRYRLGSAPRPRRDALHPDGRRDAAAIAGRSRDTHAGQRSLDRVRLSLLHPTALPR